MTRFLEEGRAEDGGGEDERHGLGDEPACGADGVGGEDVHSSVDVFLSES